MEENYKNNHFCIDVFKTDLFFILKYKLKYKSDFSSNKRFISPEFGRTENDFKIISIPKIYKKSLRKK
jgi:hypothetical protein